MKQVGAAFWISGDSEVVKLGEALAKTQVSVSVYMYVSVYVPVVVYYVFVVYVILCV